MDIFEKGMIFVAFTVVMSLVSFLGYMINIKLGIYLSVVTNLMLYGVYRLMRKGSDDDS